jgi:hypothetical protein
MPSTANIIHTAKQTVNENVLLVSMVSAVLFFTASSDALIDAGSVRAGTRRGHRQEVGGVGGNQVSRLVIKH